MMWMHIVCLVFTVYLVKCNHLPEVETPLGKIQGSWKDSYDERTFAAFQGIPYAKPPVGDLRFEDPEPVEPWPDVLEATRPSTCSQSSFPKVDKVRGDEDCLHLNVFVPSEEIDPQKNLDVLVVIHGGSFILGSAHWLTNPVILMDRDIILVTINYRVGMLGFLSTEDDVMPGNYGLKDQVMALKWVKDNIASFGGNPNSVTIAGQSAGGASVHLHYFSPLSKGLFVRGLSQSGTALDPWVIKEQPLENARKLAALVGCDTASSTEIKKCLKEKPVKDMLNKLKNFYGDSMLPFAPFAPVVEKKSKKPFLDKDPYLLLKEKRVLDVPWITSTTRDEGLFPSLFYYNYLERVDSAWTEIAPYLLDCNYTLPVSKREDVFKRIRDFYLEPNEKINNESFHKFTKILTDRLFLIGGELAAKLQSKATKSPVYYYHFNYEKGENQPGRGQGIVHGDDALYFYGSLAIKTFSEMDKKLKNICQDILYSYMTTGKPSFDGTDKWQPTAGSKLTYLNITDPDDIKLQTVDSLAPVDFWKGLGFLENENLVVKDEL